MIETSLMSPRETVRCWAKKNIQRLTGVSIEPDDVYLHHFPASQSVVSDNTITGWAHSGRPDISMTLTEAVMSDFFSAERYGIAGKTQSIAHVLSSDINAFSIFHSDSFSDFFARFGKLLLDRTGPGYLYSKFKHDVPSIKDAWRELDAAFGLYRAGPDAETYNADNELRLKPSQLLSVVRDADMQKKIANAFDAFWTAHHTSWRGLAKAHFVNAARAARKAHDLNPAEGISEEDYVRVMHAVASNVPLEGDVTLHQVRTDANPQPTADSRILWFDINGYRATDSFRCVSSHGTQVLYLPGAVPEMQAFASTEHFNNWVLEQSKEPEKLAELSRHFSLYDRQQGIFGAFSVNGVDTALLKMSTGEMPANSRHINVNAHVVNEDVFTQMAAQTQRRMNSDLDVEMKSNAEVTADNALLMLQATNAIFSIPLALLGPIGMGLNALAFGVQVGLEVVKAVDGDKQENRESGLNAALMDMATVALLHAMGKSLPVKDEANSAAVSKTHVAPAIYRRNGKFGYLAGPIRPMRFDTAPPEALNPLWDEGMEIYLQPDPNANPNAVPPESVTPHEVAESSVTTPDVGSGDHGENASTSSASQPNESASDTSGDKYPEHSDPFVVRENAFKANVELPAGGYFNTMGMIERTDIAKLYRAEKQQRVERRGDPEIIGFRDSNFFDGARKMMDGCVLITARTQAAAAYFGETQFEGNYELYEIDSSDLRAVSLVENVELNPQFTEIRQGEGVGAIESYKRDDRLNSFAEGAYEFDEVHLDNTHVTPNRVLKINKH